MKLEINHNHKRINLKNLSFKNRVSSAFLSSIVALTLFSGCTKQINNHDNTDLNPVSISEVTPNNISNIDELFTYSKEEDNKLNKKIESINDNGNINMPESLKRTILSNYNQNGNNIVTKEMLEKITELNLSTVSINDPSDLLWLNYCTNLETLKIMVFNDSILNNVSTLPNLERLAIYNAGKNNETLDHKNCKLLFSPNLNYLVINNFNIENNLLESLNQIRILDISDNTDIILNNYNPNYTNLTFLDTLIINNPYTMAVHMDSNDVNTLKNSNVKIINKKQKDMTQKLLEINEKINFILSLINVNKNSPEIEKLDNIIMFTITKLNYDNETINASSFYTDGSLYGALEKDSQICGNYAALVSTLCDRLELKDLTQMSSNHSWNLVYVDGNNYYVDTTLIDNAIRNKEDINEMKENEWYLKDPNKKMDFSHSSFNLSDMIKIERIKEFTDSETNKSDISNNEYKISINKHEYFLGAGALIGILSGLGLAQEYKRKKEKSLNNEFIKKM